MDDCCGLLIAEHRATERQLDQLAALIATDAWDEASLLFQRLQRDLLRHFALEERALFPLLSQYRSMMLLEVEHDDLLALEKAFADALTASVQAQSPTASLAECLAAFRNQLAGHMFEEEDKIFPLAQACLLPEEKMQVGRLYGECQQAFMQSEPQLIRPQPGFCLGQVDFQQPSEKPLSYQTLFDREHSTVQHIRMQAGQKLTRHWAAQHQFLLVVSGTVDFETDTQALRLEPGAALTLDSRLPFSLAALTNSQFLVFKIWPHPHFVKA